MVFARARRAEIPTFASWCLKVAVKAAWRRRLPWRRVALVPCCARARRRTHRCSSRALESEETEEEEEEEEEPVLT